MGKICEEQPIQSGASIDVLYNVSIVYERYFGASGFVTQVNTFGYLGNITYTRNDGAVQIYSKGILVNAFGVERRGFIFTRVDIVRADGMPELPPPPICRCSEDSCRVDCPNAPDGFCCIDHSLTNRLLQVINS